MPGCRRVGAVCIAAFLLARAGVLTDRPATVHRKYAPELAYRYPRLRVDPNPIWVQAGTLYTSSGLWPASTCPWPGWLRTAAAGSVEAARDLGLFPRRPAGQTQLSVTLVAQASEMRPIQELQVCTTPAKYVLHLRVEAAGRLLRSSSHGLQPIAGAVGFGSVDGMRRAFRRVLGGRRGRCGQAASAR